MSMENSKEQNKQTKSDHVYLEVVSLFFFVLAAVWLWAS